MPSLRRAVATDAAAIHALHMASIRALGTSHYSVTVVEAWCGERTPASYLSPIATKIVLVAEEANAIIAFGQLNPNTQQIEAVYVSPGATRKGVGSAILRELEFQACSLLVSQLTLDASLNAEEFYAIHGYASGARTEHALHSGVLLPCVRMSKLLHVRKGA